MENKCPHPIWTGLSRPTSVRIPGKQEIVATAQLQVCCECGALKGMVQGPWEYPGRPFWVAPGQDWEQAAYQVWEGASLDSQAKVG
jgi:hypothetical protein